MVGGLELFVRLTTCSVAARIASGAVAVLLTVLFSNVASVTRGEMELDHLRAGLGALLNGAGRLLLFEDYLTTGSRRATNVYVMAVRSNDRVRVSSIALFRSVLFLEGAVACRFVSKYACALEVTLVIRTNEGHVVVLAVLRARIVSLLDVSAQASRLNGDVRAAYVRSAALTSTFCLFQDLGRIANECRLALVFPGRRLLIRLYGELAERAVPSFLLGRSLVVWCLQLRGCAVSYEVRGGVTVVYD